MLSPQVEPTLREGKLKVYMHREKPFEKPVNEMGKNLPNAGDE
jgi:hypothetical protein